MPVGVIYGAQSGIVRRVVAADTDIQFDDYVGDGEALYEFEPKSNMLPDIISEAKSEIAQLLGKKTVDSDICAVVANDGTISQIIKADPFIDVPPEGHELVSAYSDKITTKYTYDKQTGLFTAPAVIKRAGTYIKDPCGDCEGGYNKVVLLQDLVIEPEKVIAKPAEEVG